MKIYRRDEFLKLPSGTIYCKGKPWYWEQISVKAESLPNDFIEMQLNTIESHDSGDLDKKYTEMLECGASYPLTDDYYGRDGCFDDEDLFLVYEVSDLVTLKAIIDSGIKTAT